MKYLITIAAWLSILGLSAQPYGNEWIEFDQTYFKIKVYQDGVYRLDYADLQSAGLPVESISPSQFLLIAREQEEPIHIEGGADGSLDPGDYIEFLGFKNDGWLDQEMYSNPSNVGNPHYSLVNDTIYYFLSWDDNGNHLRYALEEGTDFNNYLSPPYITNTQRITYSDDYNFGERLPFNNNIPDYVRGEGWMSNRFGLGLNPSEKLVTIPTENKASGGAPAAQCKTVFASVNNASLGLGANNHHIRIFRGPDDAVQVSDHVFQGYELFEVEFNIPHGQLSDQTLINHKIIDDLEVTSDHFMVSYTEVTYSHSLDISDLNQTVFSVGPNTNQGKYHLDLTGASYSQPIIYARGTNAYRISADSQGADLDFLVPNQSNGSSTIHLYDESAVITPSISPVSGDGLFTDYSSISLDSAFVIITHPSLLAVSEVYASYRAAGPRDAIVVNVDELYEQYGGGIPKHFHGMRRFADAILDTWQAPPAQLFLVGKSIFLQPQNNLSGSRKSESLFNQSLVPSYGSPGSDILITSGLNGGGVTPAIPIGRLSAIEASEVLEYLDKVIYNETQDPAAWMKNVLHFGGGNSSIEQDRFAGYLSNYEEIIEDTCYGGDVKTFLKTSSLPIEFNLSDSISDIIEEGVSLLTFFGHAGGGQFDQSIDDPENLTWGGHPLVLVNSCFSGDIHQPGHASTSESYTVLADKGSIGFIAAVQQGFEGNLNQYSTEMYSQLSYKNYGKPLGYLMQQTIAEITQGQALEGEARATLLMNLLQGDPAIVLFSPEKPDLIIDANSVSFYPEEITAVVDSILVEVVVTNAGKTTTDPFEVELVREFPDGSESDFQLPLNGLYYRDTVRFMIPTDFANGFGINTFRVSVDLPNNVIAEEDNFLNNRVTVTLPITDGGVFPVSPYEFAIIPDNAVTLMASTGNPFVDERDYRLQMDTTDLFDSPLLLQQEYTQSGGVIEWEVPSVLVDSMVYYWRVAEITPDPADMDWRESSFQYIADRRGWGQAHYFQFKKDRFNSIVYDRPERDFDFLTGTKLLSCEVYGNAISILNSGEYFIDFQSEEYGGCSGTHAFHVAVIDPITLEPWGTRYGSENPDHDFDNANDDGACRNRVERYFIFRTNNAAQMAGFQNMIENEIPDGHIVLIYTWRAAIPDQWPQPQTSDVFNALGATDIAAMDSAQEVPFIYAGIKGDPGSAQTIIADSLTQYIALDFDMPVSGNQGLVRSPLIGPAQEWNTLYWQASEIEISDTASISLIGYTPLGEEVQIPTPQIDLTVAGELSLGGLVDANAYPYLQLSANIKDPLELSPVQLDRWQILYQPVPEAALDPNLGFSFYTDTLQEGEELRLFTTIRNISELDMDSLLVRYWVQTSDNNIIEIDYPRQAPLLSGDVLQDTLRIPSIGLSGQNTLWVEANPIAAGTGLYDQLEQYHFNNLGRLRFMVEQDRENPILDVTFDGQHILDGDIVSAKPNIRMRLDDENPFLLMDQPGDTAYFSVFLTDPLGSQERIYFDNGLSEEALSFIPASGGDNISELDYRPDLLMDGRYTLTVLAADKSGNASGDIDYTIRFNVERASSVTEVLNYPNPFSTSTRFVFTLTGVEVPDEIRIQIMTISGKVVREIEQYELGDLHIGRNITSYAWDGRDEYGDELANGVYFYRVIVKQGGADVSQRQTSASQFFKKGFGKMYIMR